MSRTESVGRLTARKQSASAPPVTQMVSVAVLPPRLPAGLAPPTGIGIADAFGWDESLNWTHNQPIPPEGEEGKKKQKKKFIYQPKRAHPDNPPFRLRQVPYDVWRKHYAKDKDGNYRGTHAPAEDCLLKPDDVQKWRLGEATTMADKWTRGKEALPVYAEVESHGRLPEYEVDYDGPPREEPTVGEDEEEIARILEREDRAAARQGSASALHGIIEQDPTEAPHPSGLTDEEVRNYKGSFKKDTWKKRLQRGFENVSFGA